MLDRRQLLSGGISGFFAFAARNQWSNLFAKVAGSERPAGKAKRCVVLWMEGGPSQIDTFDPKPGKQTGGPVSAIKTSVPGIQISEYLPEVAKQMDNLSIIRNLTSDEGEHVRATHYLHTGFKFVPSFPRPSMGSVVSGQFSERDIPKYVALGSPGFGPAYMGPENAPFSVQNLAEANQLIQKIRQRSRQLGLLSELDKTFSYQINDERVLQRRANIEKIGRMAQTGFGDALDIQKITSSDQQRYGDNEFGRRCLVAKRLLDLGVNFVEVQLGGWDTHERNFRNVKRLAATIDRPFAALVEDLKKNGMYNDTILIWMGEFGRTPNINSRNGRDHFPRCTPVVIGGGPIRTGLTVGETNETGSQIKGDHYRVADLFATIYSAFGILPDHEFTTSFDSPTTATDGGKLIRELL